MKAQTIRVLDVVLIGPLMVYGGSKLREQDSAASMALILAGAATIAYNGINYLKKAQANG